MTRKQIRKMVIFEWGQILAPWLVALCSGLLVWEFGVQRAFDGIIGASVVLAGFSVAAFNLRFRIVDTLQKWSSSQDQARRLGTMFADCRKAIDNCIVLFVFTAAILAFGKVLDVANKPLAIAFAAVAYGLFSASLLEFLKILKSFRALEDFTLQMIIKNADKHPVK